MKFRDESGFTLTELLISMGIMLVVSGAVFGLISPAQGTFRAQPEVSDMQQRMRVSAEVLQKELLMAGAGTYQGAVSGSLTNYFAPIVPRNMGSTAPDAYTVARADAVTLMYVPNTYSQTTISQAMPPNSSELKVNDQPNCPQGQQLCGFKTGMQVVIFDTAGNFDPFVITNVQNSAGHLQHRGQDLSYSYGPGASVTQVQSQTYYRDAATNQLRQDDGYGTNVPVADNIVDLRFEYFGDAKPPTRPKPPVTVANCLYDANGNLIYNPAPLITGDGSLAPLPLSMFETGPWCGSGDTRFDVDLYRVRKVRVTLRTQVAQASLRGANTTLFRNPGSSRGAEGYVPDFETVFEVSPRNLNLAR